VAARRGEWPPELRDATLIVNATPVKEELLVRPRADHAVADLAYLADGRPTALVAAARAAGCAVVVDGLEILVRQGAAAFERWTGVPAPVGVMRGAVRH
jgi:shikimate dehydrogenase